MTARAVRSKRNRLANRRPLTPGKAEGARVLPLLVVKADGTLVPVERARAAPGLNQPGEVDDFFRRRPLMVGGRGHDVSA